MPAAPNPKRELLRDEFALMIFIALMERQARVSASGLGQKSPLSHGQDDQIRDLFRLCYRIADLALEVREE
jgi:hypothetical protein